MFKLRFLASLLVMGATVLYAQESAAPKQEAVKVELPSGETILDKFVEATGGVDAYKKMKNMVMKATNEMSAMGMKQEITVYKAEPNLILTEMEMPGIGKILSGFDGKTAWGYSALQGPSIVEGEQAKDLMKTADFREDEWRTKISKAETIALETVEGEECYKVALEPKIGNPITNYYSKNTGLLVKMIMKIHTPMGDLEGEMLLKDYRKVGDLLMSFKSVTNVMGQTMITTASEIKINADIPESTFEPPAEVKALINK